MYQAQTRKVESAEQRLAAAAVAAKQRAPLGGRQLATAGVGDAEDESDVVEAGASKAEPDV